MFNLNITIKKYPKKHPPLAPKVAARFCNRNYFLNSANAPL